MPSIFIVAMESSGDQLGVGLIKALRAQNPAVQISGIGGEGMRALNVSTELDMSHLAVFGYVDTIKVFPLILQRLKQVSETILSVNPDCLVLIDSWGFMIQLCKRLKQQNYRGKIIKYVAPQVWATREGRAKTLATYADHLLTIHSFEAPYFEKYGLPVTYVGHPIFDANYEFGDGDGLRKQFNIPLDSLVISVFFGSRLSEIQQLTKPFADAVAHIKQQIPELYFISPVSGSIATDVAAAAGHDHRLQNIIFLPEDRKYDVFKAADMALACSGTITSELACAGVPTIVAYRLHFLSYFILRCLYHSSYISIVNMAANAALMPEYIQKNCTGELLASAILSYAGEKDLRSQARENLLAQTSKMRSDHGNADMSAAQTILRLLS